MKTIRRNRRLDRLIKTIDSKLSHLLPKPFGSDFIFFNPDGFETNLPDSGLKALTTAIEHEFENCDGDTFAVLLQAHMKARNITARSFYTAALVEKSYFYQLLSGKHLPSRDLAIRLCFGLKLSLAESRELLQSIGYVFYERNRRDIVIIECLKHRTGLYIAELLLDRYGEISLCNRPAKH